MEENCLHGKIPAKSGYLNLMFGKFVYTVKFQPSGYLYLRQFPCIRFAWMYVRGGGHTSGRRLPGLFQAQGIPPRGVEVLHGLHLDGDGRGVQGLGWEPR
jgi:hypothetical protein